MSDTLEFKNRAEGWFAIAKILALIVAAGWTWWQWDRTIFPKEDHARLLRAAMTRTDLAVESSTLTIGRIGPVYMSLEHSDPDDDTCGSASELVRAAAMSVTLLNARAFPVQATLTSAEHSSARIDPVSGNSVWGPVQALDVQTVLGAEFASPRVIEPGGRAKISGLDIRQSVFCDGEIKLTQVALRLDLRGVDPSTGALIDGARNEKIVRLRGLWREDSEFPIDGPMLAGDALGNYAIIERAPDPNMIDG